ncbi:hypothetical protein KK083_26375 [Fulvivirgaceae bacterium PWU4]|uniref:Uncharacterized protein n=1 Tax=Chryseosolibacter histidini TaxID=2782349 RepID=A0AAP2DQ22_9BACT|nr:hypothetical protein [Chryseosolibacter histidini]MBT1700441.1 hypothetical protein [Chryseosolibacter histidini]
MDSIVQFAGFAGADLEIFTSSKTLASLNQLYADKPRQISYSQLENRTDLFSLKEKIQKDDLLLVVQARRHTVSYASTMDKIPGLLSRSFSPTSIIILYPSLSGNFQ